MTGPPIHANFVSDIVSNTDFAAELLGSLLDPAIWSLVQPDSLQLEDSSFVDAELRNHESDLLFSTKLNEGETASIYVLFEHKSHPEKDIIKQLLKYLYLIHISRDELLPVLPIVFHHGRREWRAPRSLGEHFTLSRSANKVLGEYLLDFSYILIDVNSLNIDGLRASLEQKAFLEILNAIWRFDQPDNIGRYLEKFREVFLKPSNLEFLEKVLAYIYRVQDIEYRDMSRLLKAHVSPERSEAAMTTAERLELKAKLEVARNLLADGISLEQIQKYTGLTKQDLVKAGIIKE